MKVHPREEGAGVQADRPLQIVGDERGAKFSDIAREHRRIESELGRAQQELGLLQIPANGEKRLIECVPGVLRIALWPEEEAQPVSAHAAGGSRSKYREQCERPTSGLGPAEHIARIRLDGETAERAKSQTKTRG
jgi:hypothetical protein